MKINYGYIGDAECKEFHDLVIKTCCATLVDITFHGLSMDLKFEKYFSKVKTLGFCFGNIDDSLWQFTEWFPKVEKLLIEKFPTSKQN